MIFGAVVASLAASGAFALGRLGDESSPPAPLPPPPELPRFVERIDVSHFHRGNLHTHSTESDGDAPVATIVSSYRDRGYAFLAMTEHNKRLDPAAYARFERPGFRIVAGEEVTTTGADKPVHVNAICASGLVEGGAFDTKRAALSHAVERTHELGGIALVNHPNFARALDAEDLWSARDAELLEIWSGHPYVYSAGVDGRPSHEALWDEMLTRGARFFGVAVDDAHHYGDTPPAAEAARPFRAWVATFAAQEDRLSANEVCESLRRGHFYSSNGAAIRRFEVNERTMTVWTVLADSLVEFIGPRGAVLSAVRPGKEGATYELRGNEQYVRARVTNARGERAWTQPMWTERSAAPR